MTPIHHSAAYPSALMHTAHQLSLDDSFLGIIREGLASQATLRDPSQPAPSLQITEFITEPTAALKNWTLNGDGSVPRAGSVSGTLTKEFLLVFSQVGLELREREKK